MQAAADVRLPSREREREVSPETFVICPPWAPFGDAPGAGAGAGTAAPSKQFGVALINQ